MLVFVESPFAGDIAANTAYARAAMADCFKRDEVPLATHMLYTQPGVLDDTVPAERAKGMAGGFSWARHADYSAFYIDRGISGGMMAGLEDANTHWRPIKFRRLGIT